MRTDALTDLALGLLRRCRLQVHLGLNELSEQGMEQRGPLLRAFQQILREHSATEGEGTGSMPANVS